MLDSGINGDNSAGRILVVDDEAVIRELFIKLLESGGYSATAAADGESALGLALTGEFDCILLDVNMPGLNGFEVCRRLRADPATAALAVIMITALDNRTDRLAGIESGANDYLAKPIDVPEVLLRVRNATCLARLHAEVRDQLARITELERLKENLQQMIINDLSSPLCGLLGYLEMAGMEETGPPVPELRKLIGKAQAAGCILHEMIRQLLNVMQLEEGKMPLDRKRWDLAESVAGAVGRVGAKTDWVDLAVSAPAGVASAEYDRDVIERVVANLLDNAIRYAPAGSRVEIRLERTGERAILTVSDRGPGILPEYRALVFEKFGAVGLRTEGKRFSTGLGLAFCKLAVEAHGGTITVDCPPDGGNVFRVELPAAG